MKQKLPTVFILMVMVLLGAMYWVDLSYYTDPETGFTVWGSVWVRYAILVLPVLMCLLGLRTVGPRGIGVLRAKSPALGAVFAVAGAAGAGCGVGLALVSVQPPNAYRIVLGVLMVWYGVWMVLTAVQMMTQNAPSPTKSALLGVLAALPFCLILVYRIMIRPSSLHRVGPVVRALGPMFALLWLVILLRGFYIALPKKRVRWLYFLGVMCFLFSTCLELPLTVHEAMFSGVGAAEMLQSVMLAMFGLVAGCVSAALAGQSAARRGAVPVEESKEL